MHLYNTPAHKIEVFSPLNEHTVSLYTCGPTVYDYPTVGNWMAYIYWDLLVRALTLSGYDVSRVMNITDVGHLVSDADEGEDKLEKGAKREGKTAREIADFYTADFIEGMAKLHMIPPTFVMRATDYIPEQLALITTLKSKGFTYQIDDGIYFDTAKFPRYAEFAGLDLAAQKAGARIEFNAEKRNPSDFALWKFSPAGEQRDMEWPTPPELLDDGNIRGTQASVLQGDTEHRTEAYGSYGEGEVKGATPQNAASDIGVAGSAGQQDVTMRTPRMGFPGWHLECSAMAMKQFGPTLDIHTGGIDHIPVHHTNEIAQSEAATGATFANYWVHSNHLKVDGHKISKSLGNGYTLQDLSQKGFTPEDFKFFALQSHYRTEGNFTWENLEAAKNRLARWHDIAVLRWQSHDTLDNDDDKTQSPLGGKLLAAKHAALDALQDDLNSSLALTHIDAAFDEVEQAALSTVPNYALTELLTFIDDAFGLDILGKTGDVTDDIKALLVERSRARDTKDWAQSDKLRDELVTRGIGVRDGSQTSTWYYF